MPIKKPTTLQKLFLQSPKKPTTLQKRFLRSPKKGDKAKQKLMQIEENPKEDPSSSSDENEEENISETASNTNLFFPNSPPSPSCFSLLNYSCSKQPTEKLSEQHETWRESQRSTTSQISRQLKCRWALDELIEGHLSRLRTHCIRTMHPSHPADVPRVMLPSWNPPFLTASLSWLGDTWRPSNMLAMVAPSLTSPLSTKSQRLLNGWLRRLRTQEAVLDEEMAEYQSMSVLNLLNRRCPSGGDPRKKKKGGGGFEIVCVEMRKIEGVVARAHRMRYKTVEKVVKGGALDETQAAEFLVALARIEEAVRKQAVKWRARVGAVSIEVQAFDGGTGH